jgi:lipopolysaccharide export system protein LptA
MTITTPIRPALAIAATLTSLWLSPGAFAQSADASGLSNLTAANRDVDVEADSMEVLDAQKKAIFTGNVKATRGGTVMSSARMEVSYAATQGSGSGKTEVSVINATGGVVIDTGKQEISGKDAILDLKGNLLTVTGGVVVKEGSSVVRGEKLRVDLKSKVSSMTGGRVKGSFVPNTAAK